MAWAFHSLSDYELLCYWFFSSVRLLWLWGTCILSHCSSVVPIQSTCLQFLFFSENYLLCFRISLAASSLNPTEPVVWCFMLAASLVKKSLKLLQFLALVGLSHKVSHARFNNPVSSMARYTEQRIFFLVNGSSPASENSFRSLMQVHSTAMGVVGSHFASNSISFYCSFFGRTVP